MCKPAVEACSTKCAGHRALFVAGGLVAFVCLLAQLGQAVSQILLVIEDVGAVICALLVAGAVAWLWRLGAVAYLAAPALRVTVWTCTQTHALASAGVRGCARVRARRGLAARRPEALPAGAGGLGGVIAGAVSSAVLSGPVVPRSDAVTTRPTTRPTTGPDDPYRWTRKLGEQADATWVDGVRVTTGPYRLGERDRIVVVVDEAAGLLGQLGPDQLAELLRGGRAS
jgi:hypothetical protein